MRRLKLFLSSVAVFLFPIVTFAQGLGNDGGSTGGRLGVLLNNILAFISNVLIPFILGIGFLVFVWGMFQYFIAGGANDEAKEKGKSLMIYATLAFVFIIIFYGVVNFLVSATGLQDNTLLDIPTVPAVPARP